MGFYLGILTKWPPPKGWVHEIQILIRDLLKEFLQKIFGEEMGGARPPYRKCNKTNHVYDPKFDFT